MARKGMRLNGGLRHAISASLAAMLLGACSTGSDGDMLFGLSPFGATSPALVAASGDEPTAGPGETVATAAPAEARMTAITPEATLPNEGDDAPSEITAGLADGEAAGTRDGFLSSLFSRRARADAAERGDGAASPLVRRDETRPPVAVAAARPGAGATSRTPSGVMLELPGVNHRALFEISRKSGLDDDSDIDLHEMPGSYRVASLAPGMARLAPNGLRVQTQHVDVACLQPGLVRMLRTVERHFGSRVVVTSGYRSPEQNARARGARNSLHMRCAAADIQVEGVDKLRVAAFVRSLPGRGGVGTYCHTESVHVDIGPERDWDWRCRRRS